MTFSAILFAQDKTKQDMIGFFSKLLLFAHFRWSALQFINFQFFDENRQGFDLCNCSAYA